MEFTHHYAEVRPVEAYADHRILLIGKQNSGFELATGLLPWARQIVLASPSRARLSVETKTLVGVRARYVQPYEDHVLGGGVSVLDAAIDRIERADDGRLTAYLRRTDGGPDLTIEVDDAISATGFVCPAAGPARSSASGRSGPAGCPSRRRGGRAPRCPASTSRGRSGRARRASRSTACRPTPGPSTAPATTPACWPRTSPRRISGSARAAAPGPGRRRPASSRPSWPRRPSSSTSAATWPGCSPPTRPGGMRDDGVQPLAHVLDAGGPDAIAATLEADGSGAIYPVVYTRIGGKVVEQRDRARSADALRHGRFAAADRRPRRAGR